MAKYDQCLDVQEQCENSNSTTGCMSNTMAQCDDILQSCYNPGAVAKPRPTGTILDGYIATWTAPETSLPSSPSVKNEHCLAAYDHCSTIHASCLTNITTQTTPFDKEHLAKACYQILLRCKSQLLSCHNPSGPLATWIPDDIAQGVDVPPWFPDIVKTEGNVMCIAGYQRCLVLYQHCLMTAKMMQDAGWLEKAEIHRNKCQDQLVPLCTEGVAVCDELRR
jgi:hypothetical protein